jgi:shikimate kinase
MRQQGAVIYLRASANVLAERLAEDPEDAQRPSLTGKPIVEEMRDVLASREPLYQEVAHHVLDATQSPEEVVEHILQILANEKVKLSDGPIGL